VEIIEKSINSTRDYHTQSEDGHEMEHTCQPLLEATDVVAEQHGYDHEPQGVSVNVPTSLTPLKWQVFARLLQPHPDQTLVAQLIHDLKVGVRIGYQGPRDAFRPSPNLPILPEHESFIDDEIQKEVAVGRRMGPFDSPPFPNLIVSPIGVVTKRLSTKLRMIHHLSWPRQLSADTDSINEHISPEDSKTVLQSFDDAVTMLATLSSTVTVPNGKPILLCKIDIKSAYRLVPVHPDDWHCLGMQWRGKYYYDKVLVFGLSSACLQWERVATAAHWIASHHLGIHLMVHYIDDYLLISVGPTLANAQLQALLLLFGKLGLPISMDKLEGPTQKIVFLGIQVDTCDFTISIDNVRLQHIQSILQEWMMKSHATIHDIQSLIGTLSFCCKVIRAGRVFLRRLINFVSHLYHRSKHARAHVLHKLTLSVKKDIQWWLTYMKQFNGTMSIYPIAWCNDRDMYIATDACETGYGAMFGPHWFAGTWSEEEERESQRDSRDSMPWKELYALVLAATTWGQHWSKRNIIFHLDCEPMVFALSRGGSKHPHIMSLLRTLSFIAATNNFRYKVVHIAGVTNVGPDHLSRGRVCAFQSLFPNSNPLPTPVCPLPCHDW
jgi:Reverse transcriptase (RNA-dependent DNA polymerase)